MVSTSLATSLSWLSCSYEMLMWIISLSPSTPPSIPQVFLLSLFPVAIDQISSREIITWHHYHSQHFYLPLLVSAPHHLIKFREECGAEKKLKC